VLGVSWFWFFGATYLTQLPNYVRLSLGGNEQVVTLLLALFSIGIAVGSLLCERLSGKRVELGLVPVGSIGMTVFAIDLYFAAAAPAGTALIGASAWLAQAGSVRVVIDVLLLGAFGGLYIVPLYALIQQRAEPANRARVIAANNILNAAFMTVSAVGCALLLGSGLSIPQLFLTVALMNAAVAVFIYTLVPEFFLRFVIWILINIIYRVRGENLDQIPDEGPVLLACNHVSFIDSLIVGGMVRRPVRFVMYHKIYNTPGLRTLFNIAGAVPIAPAKEDPAALEAAMNRIADYLNDGEVVCVFPEGALTPDGELREFRDGVARMAQRSPAPVVPLALRGLWGSWFSRASGAAMSGLPRRFWSRVSLAAGPPIAADALDMEQLRQQVAELRADQR
ncbi:glycerol acyltransferase, partial [bacterium]|nr:glycerol acyltransferase [bacterium]